MSRQEKERKLRLHEVTVSSKMNTPLIKFCGMTCIQDIEAANALSPDYIGFVFYSKSKRYVTPKEASVLRSRLNPGTTAVGVFVNESIQTVAALVQNGNIDVVQLHGIEDDAYIAALRSICSAPIIAAFRIGCSADLAAPYSSTADQILLDGVSAGAGVPFDWTLLGAFDRPYFLAGGLNPGNVAEAIRVLHPYAVDVSSGIEADDSHKKDMIKMKAFINQVRTM